MHDKMLWFNDNIQYMFHANIVEYDMVAASVSVCEHFNLLDKNTIEQLKLMPKDKRTVKMGMLQKDKEFSEKLLSGIREMRRKFLEVNGLDDTNILSLHSDACIFSSRKKIVTDIDGVKFRHDGTWSAYVRYNKIEMFYANDYITFKNVPADLMKEHTIGINKYLRKVFGYIEDYNPDVVKYISKFESKYLKDEFPEYYYPAFGKRGTYKMTNLELFAAIANIVIAEVGKW